MEQDLLLVKSLVKGRNSSFKSPKPDAPRLLAFDILHEVNRNGGYSNLLLPAALSKSGLEQRDKGFVTELVYGTLRMQGRHDFIFEQISDRPWLEVDAGIVDIARLGAHQLFEMRVPAHAAVSATVELARKVLGESKASFVNALLRKASAKTLEEWLAPLIGERDIVVRLSILHSHPEWIVSAYFDLLKDYDEVEAALAVNNVPARPTLVAWPGFSTRNELVALGATATNFSQFGAIFDGNPSSLEPVVSRRAGVQDEGSQLVAVIFAAAASRKLRWLDLCAGPGGKAALLSTLANGAQQRFTANEVSQVRARLVEQVVHGARVWNGDGREIAQHQETFDAILADVPCTGLGALRRRPEVRWRRQLSDLRELTSLQMQLVDGAVSVLEVGGVFGFATCSPHFAETRVAVMDILKKYPQLRSIDVTPFLPGNLVDAVDNGNLALWTHKHNTDSMFLALFERIE
jgi:16S rRNA (cytosine967-C5)-methyltransferase